jgi:hypothetical protein
MIGYMPDFVAQASLEAGHLVSLVPNAEGARLRRLHLGKPACKRCMKNGRV